MYRGLRIRSSGTNLWVFSSIEMKIDGVEQRRIEGRTKIDDYQSVTALVSATDKVRTLKSYHVFT